MNPSNRSQKQLFILTGISLVLSSVLAALLYPSIGAAAAILLLVPVMIVAYWLIVLFQKPRKQDSGNEEKWSAELEALRRASLQLTSSLELQPILETILENATELIRAEDVHVFLYDGNRLHFGAALMGGKRQREPFKEPRQDGITYNVARSGEPLVIPNVNIHSLFQNWKWGGAIVALPLRIGQRVCGVMNIAFDKPHNFTENEMHVLQLFADQAALAIQNAQLYEAVRQQAAEMEQRVIERTAELQEAKERAEAVFNNTFDAIMILNAQGEIEQTNSTFQIWFDIETAKQAENLVHENDRSEFLAHLRDVIATQQPARAEITLQKHNDDYFVADVALAPIVSQNGDHPGIVCSIRDISLRKRAEEKQRILTRGLRTVLGVANALINCPDVDTTLRQAVEAARNELGLERCAIFIERNGYIQGTYGTDIHRNTTDEHTLRYPIGAMWQDRLARLKPEDAQWIVIEDVQTHWDGENNRTVGTGWVAITRIPLTDSSTGIFFNDTAISKGQLDETQQEVISVFCSLLGKIVERKGVEEDIRRALERETELNDIKSATITTISHEFRTPMAIIQSSTQLLKHYSDRMDETKKRNHLNKIEHQIEQMTTLLENVLTINRSQKQKLACNPQSVDVIALCQTMIEEVRLTIGKEHTIIFESKGDYANCRLDEELFCQIVSNLLTNAVKYSPAHRPIYLHLTRDSQQIIIRVQDEGIGIPEEDLKFLFQDFHRARNVGNVPGAGLGLSIVKRAAAAHGGMAAVESIEGKGSTFTVTLQMPSGESETP